MGAVAVPAAAASNATESQGHDWQSAKNHHVPPSSAAHPRRCTAPVVGHDVGGGVATECAGGTIALGPTGRNDPGAW